ncbi:MAG: M15 family metallopeptidase [Acidobacteriales bacterium]|nr:M15 family metallopeptidase [Terriglobales bacterium]
MAASPAPALQPPHGFAEIVQVFGDVRQYIGADGNVTPQWPAEILTTIDLPFPMRLDWDHSKLVSKLCCHKRVASLFRAVLADIQSHGLADKVETYGGCYAFRAKRGLAQYSAHAWGIAIDLNPATNALGTAGDMNAGLIQVFEAHGFEWGGHFTRRDPMHFQFCRGY